GEGRPVSKGWGEGGGVEEVPHRTRRRRLEIDLQPPRGVIAQAELDRERRCDPTARTEHLGEVRVSRLRAREGPDPEADDSFLSVLDPALGHHAYPTRFRIGTMSSAVNARKACVRTLPSAPMLSPSAVTAASSGASRIVTTSYWPRVQYASFTVTLSFLAMARTASTRLVVSLTLRIPCSVKLPRRMYVGTGVSFRATNAIGCCPRPGPGSGPRSADPWPDNVMGPDF